MGESTGTKYAKKYTKKAVGSLTTGQGVLEAPGGLFDFGRQIGLQWGKQPLSLSPEVVAGMKQRGFDTADQAFQGALDTIGERQGAAGLYRSGGTNQGFQNAAAQYGGQIADVSRQIDTQAALQRNADFMQAIQSLLALSGAQQRPYEQIANAYMGASSNPAFSQPGPLQGIGAGLGQLAGTFFGGSQPWIFGG